MILKSSKMLGYGGVLAVKPSSSKKTKRLYQYDKLSDIRIINFCIEYCPHEKCNGNRCKELVDFSKSIQGEE